MHWNWEEMTAPEFGAAVKKAGGVCLVPIGCLERHGPHLPLGSDTLVVRTVAEQAAAQEPAVVFPSLYLGQVQGAKNRPGCIALRHSVLFELLNGLCDEIARNGLKKIILLNGHGGNEHLLQEFLVALLDKPRDYAVYLARVPEGYVLENDPQWKRMHQSKPPCLDYHAGELETGLILAAYPHLVRKKAMPRHAGLPAGRLKHLSTPTSVGWTADYPDHYAGDARYASVTKGRYLIERHVRHLVAVLRTIKRDRTVARLQAEFYREAGMMKGRASSRRSRR